MTTVLEDTQEEEHDDDVIVSNIGPARTRHDLLNN